MRPRISAFLLCNPVEILQVLVLHIASSGRKATWLAVVQITSDSFWEIGVILSLLQKFGKVWVFTLINRGTEIVIC